VAFCGYPRTNWTVSRGRPAVSVDGKDDEDHMSTPMQATQERLDAVLAAPPTGKSRHTQVADLARQHARHARADDLIVKQVAVTDVEADATGSFTAMVSDYRTDRQGDRFLPGAWAKAIARIREAGRPLPLLFGHDTHSPGSVIGLVQPDDIWADERGLWIKGWWTSATASASASTAWSRRACCPGRLGSPSPAGNAAATGSTNSSKSASCTRSAQRRSPRTRGP
jgi:hypothetical protein